MPTIDIKPVESRADLKRFVTFPWRIYKDDPYWVPPLISGQMARLDPDKNPFFKHAEMQLFVAERGGEIVGTISGLINRRRNAYFGIHDGYFGFFESIDDIEVARALTDTAADWCRARGMTMLRGPINVDESEELGLVIEGHDTRQALILAHTPPYYIRLLEELGFTKWYDTSAWMLTRDDIGGKLENLPRKLFVAADRVKTHSGVRVRKTDIKNHLDREVDLLFEMWNQTIAVVNSSFAPAEKEDLYYLVEEMKQIIDPDLALIAEIDDPSHAYRVRPLGFAVAVPDINQILRKVNGRLFPVGWARLLLGARGIDALSFKLLGVVPGWRRRGIEGLLMLNVIQAAWDKGFRTCDMSVIDENNIETQRDLAGLGAHIYKTFRVYQRWL